MAQPVYQTHTTTGTKTAILLDHMQAPFNANVACVLATGSCTYGLFYTLDDVNDASVTARWLEDATAPAGTTATKVVALASPIRALRVVITVISGTLEVKVLQGMSIN